MGVQDNRRLGKFPNARKEDNSRGVKEAGHAHGYGIGRVSSNQPRRDHPCQALSLAFVSPGP